MMETLINEENLITTTLVSITTNIFNKLYKQNNQNHAIHMVWRSTLETQDDSDFYQSISLVRDTILLLMDEVNTCSNIPKPIIDINISYISQLLETTNFGNMGTSCSHFSAQFGEDRRNSLIMLDHLLKGHSVHGVTPKKSLNEIRVVLEPLREKVKSDKSIDSGDRRCLLVSIDRLLWILKTVELIGTSAGLQATMFTYASIRNPPVSPSGAKSETTTDYWQAITTKYEEVGKLLDKVDTLAKRAKTAAYVGVGGAITVAGLLSGPAM